MNLEDARNLAVRLMICHNVYREFSFRFDWAKRRAGCCSYRNKSIQLSRHYVVNNSEEDIKDTILHEIAHALTPGHGHDSVWRQMCVKIGAKPERCYDGAKVKMPEAKYSAQCGGCTKIYRKHRVRKLAPGLYRYCPKCGPQKGRLEFASR